MPLRMPPDVLDHVYRLQQKSEALPFLWDIPGQRLAAMTEGKVFILIADAALCNVYRNCYKRKKKLYDSRSSICQSICASISRPSVGCL